jgi:hypothetical protein
MKPASLTTAAAVAIALAACAQQQPYLRLRGAPTATTTVSRPVFDAAGLRLDVATVCRVSIIEHWCPLTNPRCRPNPEVRKTEQAQCPKDLEVKDVSVRAPWGQVFPAAVSAGVVTAKVDWAGAGIDPADAQATKLLAAAWTIHSDDGLVDASFDPAEADVTAEIAAINHANGDDGGEAAASEHAALTAAFVSEPGADGVNRVGLSVTNRGPDPAYKVVAHLRSSSTTLHGLELAFGRIASGETKTKAKDISLTGDPDEPNPTVVAAITAANAPPASATGRVHLQSARRASPPALALACTLVDKEPAPGQRVRVQCESSNTGDTPVRGVAYQIALDKAAAKPVGGPPELAGHAHVAFELVPTLPANAKLGSTLAIVITMTAPSAAPVQQKLSVEVVEFHGMCRQGKLTRDGYRAKRKRLETALAAGALSQDEFDKYDSELVSCIE